MKPDVAEALAEAIELRRRVLRSIDHDERVALVEALLEDFFVTQRATLMKWASLTGQSAQVDTGYIAQHVASIVLAEPGQGFKGKGLDLADGSEVKSAAILSGVDRPRWNHDMGTLASDRARGLKGLRPKWQVYLEAPFLFYLLFDRVVEDDASGEVVLRVRAWCIDTQGDRAWRDLAVRFVEGRGPSQYNMQLHPPVGYDDSIVVNTLGNLDMADVLLFDARLSGLYDGGEFRVDWIVPIPEQPRPVLGRCRALLYKRDPSRASRLSGAAEMSFDVSPLRELLPDADLDAILAAARTDVVVAASEDEEADAS